MQYIIYPLNRTPHNMKRPQIPFNYLQHPHFLLLFRWGVIVFFGSFGVFRLLKSSLLLFRWGFSPFSILNSPFFWLCSRWSVIVFFGSFRSEERRVGKEGSSRCGLWL